MTLSVLWSLVLAIHVLAMAYWVGGGLFAIATTRASVTLLDVNTRQNVLLQTYSRYCRTLMHLIPASLLTGWAMVIHDGGFAVMPWPIDMMQVLGIVMAIVFIWTLRGPLQSARRAMRPQAKLFDAIRTRIAIMVGLGALTTLCAALGSI